MKHFTVFWVAGKRDGETLYETDDKYDAQKFAKKFYAEHEEEFDTFCGGVAIVDNKNDLDIDW